MREGWEVKKLSEVCENLDNQRIPITKNKREEGNIPYYGASGIVDYVKDYIFDEDLLLVSEDGANLLARTYPIAFSISGKNWVNNHAHVLRFGNMDTQKYIEYYFSSIKLDDYVSGMAQPKLNQKMLNSIQIPIPPLPEQTQIVKTLDLAFAKLDQAKANLEKNLHNAKEFFQSKLNEVFSQRGEGWEEKRLGDVCDVLNGYAFKSKDTQDKSNTQLLRMGNLYQNKLNLERKPVFYPDSFADQYSDYVLKENDLIMSLTGTVDKTDYGYTVRIDSMDVNLLLNQRIMKIMVLSGDELDSKYLHYFLLSPDFLKTLYATANGTRQANLSSKTILTLSVPVPKLAFQKEIVIELDRLHELSKNIQTHYQQKLTNLEELKKSILQKAFAGELM